ncbi:acyltransferase family protein [Pontibacter akesuensis]|uniref:Peptidoglycan/LPS O-acetylase OafA/YrhL, contains acyltransferase and SGNH-hydrolase domains n=1 Tax=Pontibacter akesuensis TaxID=388950 RepID=A0A1I7G3I4_9BACT|nr:acyltransferase [Pontibacter akesuensis]GHA59022.1 hypothetical protein GCM10007389_08740 [Pontibacter akesuensis]SFU43022.1 Peptidoglycan/LPS O-acetylase OafA/YrhL, contains acyltransferase and SGNH-hydrolase domains [Pontibacter akesuensis]
MKHFQQIDVIKGLAILMVLLLHSLSRQELLQSYAVYHIWQAVPLFMVVMGLNAGLSIQRKEQHLNLLYTREYFTKKATRILTPFMLIFALSILVGFLWQWLTNEAVLAFSWYTLVGVLPVTGKGNYFITLLLQSIFLLPIIGYAFRKKPVLTSITLVVLEVLFQLLATQVAYFDKENYLYDAAFPRYFSAIAFGLWLAYSPGAKKQWPFALPLVILGVIAAGFLWLVVYQGLKVDFLRPEWFTQHLLTFGYAAFWVWLGLRLLPSSSNVIFLKLLATLGKASYHIFLVQVLYFGLLEESPVWQNLGICLLLGYLFYMLESNRKIFTSRAAAVFRNKDV